MPTRLIKKYIEEFAKFLRNQQDYDDFEYGTEVIPGDRTWVNKNNQKSSEFKIKSKQAGK